MSPKPNKADMTANTKNATTHLNTTITSFQPELNGDMRRNLPIHRLILSLSYKISDYFVSFVEPLILLGNMKKDPEKISRIHRCKLQKLRKSEKPCAVSDNET